MILSVAFFLGSFTLGACFGYWLSRLRRKYLQSRIDLLKLEVAMLRGSPMP